MANGAVEAGFDVTLVTERQFRAPIEEALAASAVLRQHLHPTYVGLPTRVMHTWEHRFKLVGFQLYNMAWQLLLLRRARALHRDEPFDLAHHVTLTTDWVPSGAAFVPGLPLVWGPLGGGIRVPPPCRTYLSLRGRQKEVARRIMTDPLRATLASRAARRCALLLAANPEQGQRLGGFGPDVRVHPNVFVSDEWYIRDDEVVPVRRSGDVDGADPRRAIFAGRLMAWKGVHLALAALQQPVAATWRLDVYGDGPERRKMERTIRRANLGGRITLHGWRPRAEIRQALLAADAFLYPSMREASPWVVAEALAVGCPVVCLDVGGPPLLLAGTGQAVEPTPAAAHDLAQALNAVVGMERTVVRWDAASLPSLLADWYRDALRGRQPAPAIPAGAA